MQGSGQDDRNPSSLGSSNGVAFVFMMLLVVVVLLLSVVGSELVTVSDANIGVNDLLMTKICDKCKWVFDVIVFRQIETKRSKTKLRMYPKCMILGGRYVKQAAIITMGAIPC